MTSYAVDDIKGSFNSLSIDKGPQKAALKQDVDMEMQQFETEVLYDRIDELEKQVNAYQKQQQRIRQIVMFNFDDPEKMRENILNVVVTPVKTSNVIRVNKKKSNLKAVSDQEIEKVIKSVIVID